MKYLPLDPSSALILARNEYQKHGFLPVRILDPHGPAYLALREVAREMGYLYPSEVLIAGESEALAMFDAAMVRV